MFVGNDESVWGMGYRAQGLAAENRALKVLETPHNLKNFKKVVHGKFLRCILTQEGRLFYAGQVRKYIFGSHIDRNAHLLDFYEIPKDFFPAEAGDDIVDITLGKHYFAMVMTSGKIYASGFVFYRHME